MFLLLLLPQTFQRQKTPGANAQTRGPVLEVVVVVVAVSSCGSTGSASGAGGAYYIALFANGTTIKLYSQTTERPRNG